MKAGGELTDLDANALTELVNERLRKIYLNRHGVRAYLGRAQNNVAKLVLGRLEEAAARAAALSDDVVAPERSVERAVETTAAKWIKSNAKRVAPAPAAPDADADADAASSGVRSRVPPTNGSDEAAE